MAEYDRKGNTNQSTPCSTTYLPICNNHGPSKCPQTNGVNLKKVLWQGGSKKTKNLAWSGGSK